MSSRGSAAALYLGSCLWLGGGATSHFLRNCLCDLPPFITAMLRLAFLHESSLPLPVRNTVPVPVRLEPRSSRGFKPPLRRCSALVVERPLPLAAHTTHGLLGGAELDITGDTNLTGNGKNGASVQDDRHCACPPLLEEFTSSPAETLL